MAKTLAITSVALAWEIECEDEKTGANDSPSCIYQSITLKGHIEEDDLWLGLSFKQGNGKWEEREPRKIEGNFSEQVIIKMRPNGYSQIRADLWKEKPVNLAK